MPLRWLCRSFSRGCRITVPGSRPSAAGIGRRGNALPVPAPGGKAAVSVAGQWIRIRLNGGWQDAVASLGSNLRYNRQMAGCTQESLAFSLGGDRTTVGKWERGDAFPYPGNIRALRKLGMPKERRQSRSRRARSGQPALTPELAVRVMETFGCRLPELRGRVPHFRADWERALVACCRLLTGKQRVAVLEIVSSMEPSGSRELP